MSEIAGAAALLSTNLPTLTLHEKSSFVDDGEKHVSGTNTPTSDHGDLRHGPDQRARTQKWWQWFNVDDTPEERKLILKIDLLILVPACLGYFVKILDSAAVGTAYVSGMKESLSMFGSELTYAGSIYTAGYVAGQIPFTILATVFPTRYWIPFCDLMWAILTIATCKVKTVHGLYALRFFVGLFGSLYFPTIQYLIGSWYRTGEITKRAAIFFIASQVGGMASGYIESALYVTLNGARGLESWRWLFLIDGIITFPVAILAYIMLPGVPERCTSFFLTKREVELAQQRLAREERQPLGKLNLDTFKGLARTWHWPVLVIFAIFFSNGDGVSSYSGLPLWLQSIGQSVVNINTISTVIPAVTIVFAIGIAIYSDSHANSQLSVIVIIGTLNLFAAIVLAVWYGVPAGLKYFVFFLSGSADGIAAVVYSWANEICSPLTGQQRAIVLSSMNSFGNAFAVWLPLLVWKTVDAPRYLKGYTFQACDCLAMIATAFIVSSFWKREQAVVGPGCDIMERIL